MDTSLTSCPSFVETSNTNMTADYKDSNPVGDKGSSLVGSSSSSIVDTSSSKASSCGSEGIWFFFNWIYIHTFNHLTLNLQG